MDYGPTFTVPAMRAGTYQVFATMNPYCAPNSPCPLMMAAPSLAGALVVSKSTTKIVRGSPNLNTISKPNFLTPGFKTSSKTNAQSQWVAPNGRTLKVKRND